MWLERFTEFPTVVEALKAKKIQATFLLAPLAMVLRDQGVEYVLTQPPDRVSYCQLTPTDEDMRSIMTYAIKAGILKRPIDLSDLVDTRFIPKTIEPAKITVK